MAVQYKSEGSLGRGQQEWEGEHGVMMKSGMSPNLRTIFLQVTQQMINEWDTCRKWTVLLENDMHVSYAA